MAAAYRYVLDCEVAERLFALPIRQRERFVIIFHQLADDPYQSGESSFYDRSGREMQKKQFDDWLVSFWPDHAVKEVKIVGIQRIKN